MLTWERTLQESVMMKTLLCLFRKAWNTMWPSYLFWRASWCNEPSWWNCEGQLFWQLVRHLHQWTNPFPDKDVWPRNKQETCFGRDHALRRKRKKKVRKQRCTMTFPTKEEVNFNLLSGLKLLTCHPMAKSQGAILKVSWKVTPVQRPVIVCQMSTPFDITRFT